MSEQFSHSISFLSKEFDPTLNNGVGDWTDKEVTKTVTFKELIRTDATQHRLHFKIVSMMSSAAEGLQPGQQPRLGSDQLYELTNRFLLDMIVPTEEFTEQNKTELLQDSMALLTLGLWLLGHKMAPFFSIITKNLQL